MNFYIFAVSFSFVCCGPQMVASSPPTERCPDSKPIRCPGMSLCVSSLKDCPAERRCDQGSVLCEDGVCRESPVECFINSRKSSEQKSQPLPSPPSPPSPPSLPSSSLPQQPTIYDIRRKVRKIKPIDGGCTSNMTIPLCGDGTYWDSITELCRVRSATPGKPDNRD